MAQSLYNPSTNAFVAWFSSERGSPRTTSWLCQPFAPRRVRREITPELVSRFVWVPCVPPPVRGSLDET